MPTRNRLWPLTVAVAVTAACQPGPVPLTEADRAAIQAVTDSFVVYLKASNMEALSELYTEDGVVMPPNAPAVEGREAIQQWAESFPPARDFALNNVSVEGNGDLAYVRGTYTMSLAVEGMAPDNGKFVEIRRRGADGVWRIAVDIFNSNTPLPGMH